METSADRSGGIKSDRRLLSILEALADHGPIGVTALADKLDVSKSTVYAHLQTLEREEYVVKDGTLYSLGLQFLTIGRAVRDRWPQADLIRTKVDTLAETTGERAQFIVEEHTQGVYVYRATGENAVETDSGVGKRVPLNSISAGKSILAFMNERRREAVLEEAGLPGRTENTITSRAALEAELEQVRERGFAQNDEESTDGLRSVGVPIMDASERVIGAISVSGPSHRFTEERFESAIPNRILGAVNEIELNIRFS